MTLDLFIQDEDTVQILIRKKIEDIGFRRDHFFFPINVIIDREDHKGTGILLQSPVQQLNIVEDLQIIDP